MNDLYKSAAQTLIKNYRLILIVTVLAGALAVTKELAFPAAYKADTVLLVTGSEERGATTKLMPFPLNPKAYELLLQSTSVQGKVLDQLKKEGAFGTAEAPALPDFAANMDAVTDIVDETSRPVNYSPLVRLTVYGETAELATKIVDTWASVAQTLAQRAATVRLSAPAFILSHEKEEYKSTLEKAWEEMRKETSIWDLDVLKDDLKSRVAMINGYIEKRTGIERQLEVARAKLELVRGDITTTLRDSQTKYSGETVDLRGKLQAEMSQANLDLLESEMKSREEMINGYLEKRTGIERQLEVARAKLELVRGDITKMLRDSQTKYSDESVDLHGKMRVEMSHANLDLMEFELNKQQALLMRLSEEQGDKERMIKGLEEGLITTRKSLETEKPMLELGHAPSETAYWIVGGANAKSLSDLKEKVMVTQEMNPLYLELKKEEDSTLSSLSQKKAELEAVKVQIAALNERLVSGKDEFSQHKAAQGIITDDLQVADKLHTTLGAGEEITLFAIERSTLLEVKGGEVELESIDSQVEQLKVQLAAAKDQFSQHKATQGIISNNLDVADRLHTEFGTEEEMKVFTIERTTLLEVKGDEVELSAVDRQIEQLKREVEELQRQIAEHSQIQTRLKTQTEIAKSIFDDVTSAESYMSAALAVAQGENGKDKPVGLNRINTETYATEDKGLLGRKGRVLVTTLLALLLVCTFAYVKDDGGPRLRRWLVQLD